jgi:PIN domain nuclease of toxin-antitoxin system
MTARGLLADTHALLWYLDDSPSLSSRAGEAIEAAAEVYVSSASIWEIAIKSRLGKLDPADDLLDRIVDGFEQLDVTAAHAWATRELPLHHDDPFDRLLVAQSHLEGLPLISADSRLSAYGVELVW